MDYKTNESEIMQFRFKYDNDFELIEDETQQFANAWNNVPKYIRCNDKFTCEDLQLIEAKKEEDFDERVMGLKTYYIRVKVRRNEKKINFNASTSISLNLLKN